MGPLLLNSLSIATKNYIGMFDRRDPFSLKKEKTAVYCQGSEIAIKSSGNSSVLTERLTLKSKVHSRRVAVHSQILDSSPSSGPTRTSLEKHDGNAIVKFLGGKVFIITGATGFLAKVLVEKILRTVPDVGKIYLMIKAKDKEAAMERLKSEIIEAELFKGLHETYGKSYQAFMLSKLVPVIGNVCESTLGLEEDLADVIAKEVDIIVNSAASTTFDERYDVAIDVNTRGPCHLMSFAKKCKKLKLFLQVSTAYVNGQRQGILMEKPFRLGDSIARENLNSKTSFRSLLTLDVENEIKLVMKSKEAFEVNLLAQKMKELGLKRSRKYGWQDTYVFTKAMGEMLIDDMRGDVPVVIIRPSVIESTYKEPFSGWIEGNRMIDPLLLSYGKGHLMGFLADPNEVLDIFSYMNACRSPADMVVNATLAAIARHAMAKKPSINIYQIASSVVNPLVFQDLARLFYEHFISLPWIDPKGRPINVSRVKLFTSKEEFSAHLRSHGLAAMASSNVKSSSKFESVRRIALEQLEYLANIYQPYTFYRGRFDNSNSNRLMESMSEEEKKMFGFDVRSIDWKDYITNVHIPGLRRHVMKGRGTST